MNNKRAPLYDTKTYTLENKDIPQGIIFCAISIALAYYTAGRGDPLLSSATSLFCYLSVLLSSNRTKLYVPVSLCLPLLFGAEGSSEIMRLVVFTSAIALAPNRKETVTPLLLLLGLWVIYLNGAQISALLGKKFFELNSFHIQLALFEITGFLLLLILLWCRQFPALFGRLPKEVEIATVSFVLFLFATIVGATSTFVSLLKVIGTDLDTVLSHSQRNSVIITIVITSLIAIPFVLSISLNRLLRDFGKRLEYILSPDTIIGPTMLYPKVVEFHQIFARAREFVDQQGHKAREVELDVKNTLAQREEKEKELRQKSLDSDNVVALLSLCPTGILALSGSGAILSLTPALESQFGLNHFENFVGRYYLELQANEDAPASERKRTAVFLRFIARILAEQKDLARGQALRSLTQIDENIYADLTVYVFDDRIIPVDWKRIAPHITPSDVTIVIFSSTKGDQRPFLINQLHPKSLEVIGGQSIQSLSEAYSLVSLLEEKIEAASQVLKDGDYHADLESELRSLIRTGTDFSEELRAVLTEQLKKSDTPLYFSNENEKKLIVANLKDFTLTSELEFLLLLFEELHGFDSEILLSAPEAIDPEGNSVKQAVLIKALPVQFNEFKALFLSVIGILSKRTENAALSISLGTEQIGSGTAAMFRGSNPGRYSRIVLSHPGQSITGNMMPDNLHRLNPRGLSGEEVDTTLGIFALKVERMKGFFSIQSSPAKGTHLTIYLPQDPLQISSAKDSVRKLPSSKVESEEELPIHFATQERQAEIFDGPSSQSITNILIIEDQLNVRDELTGALSEFSGLTTSALSRVEALKLFQEGSVAGIGFDSESTIDDALEVSTSLERFDLILIPVLGELPEAMRLIKSIGDKYRIVVVTSDTDYADALSALHTVIPYPLEKEEFSKLFS